VKKKKAGFDDQAGGRENVQGISNKGGKYQTAFGNGHKYEKRYPAEGKLSLGQKKRYS